MNLDSLFGAPRASKKPSTLRRSRSPPVTRHIDKQRAISIARQLKLTNIGKVTLRSTSKQNFDIDYRDPSHNTDTRITRKLLIDKRKGIETARNAKDSAIGQCILQTNEYASRKLLVEQDKLVEDRERRKKYLTQKKREFRIRCAAAESNKQDSNQTGHTLPSINNTVNDKSSAVSKPKKASVAPPNYMRPLTCDKSRSNETAVAETERFLGSPFMRAVLTEEIEKVLAAVERNDNGNFPDANYETAVKREDESKPSIDTLQNTLKSRMNLTAETPSGENSAKGHDKPNIVESDTQTSEADKSHEKKSHSVGDVLKLTPPPSRSKSSSSNLRLMQNLLLPFMQKDIDATIPDTELHDEIPPSNVKDKAPTLLHNHTEGATTKTLHNKTMASSPVIGRIIQSRKESRRKKRRRKEPSFVRADRRFIDLEKNPAYNDERFTNLTSSLIPDSSRARNLYYEADILDEPRPLHATSQPVGLATSLTSPGNGRYGENMAKFEKLLEQQYTTKRNSSYF